jgi:hypothetical protein
MSSIMLAQPALNSSLRAPAGWFKSKDPSVPIGALRDNWVDGVDVVYIG